MLFINYVVKVYGYMCLVYEPVYKQESQGEKGIKLSIENWAFTAVLGQILNQSIVSVNGFYKEKVALSFMGKCPRTKGNSLHYSAFSVECIKCHPVFWLCIHGLL